MKKIYIDEKAFEVEKTELLGSELKEMAGISIDMRLVVEVKDEPDEVVINENTYEIKNKLHFFSELYIRKVTVSIDRKKYEVKSKITGMELKVLASINQAYQLIREVKDAMDEPLQDAVTYQLIDGDKIFSIPSEINNG